jgi:hypothetical protein
MRLLELACVAIVALYVWARLRHAPLKEPILRRLALLCVASWLGEDTVIRAYGFYGYSRSWDLFIDRVPLLIVLIWPVVIDSSWTLAHRLAGGRRRWLPILAALFVLADASLIEPIAVHARLWSWSEPGLFAVPPVGILGWALFTGSAVALAPRLGALTILAAPLATHALLLASWWGALRWVNRPLPSWSVAIAAWAVLLPVALWLWSRNLRARVPPGELMVRLPGALFFFVLLALYGRQAPPLIAYTFAFVAPYLALLRVR